MNIDTPSEWDVKGNRHYMLDMSLSTEYLIEHSCSSMYVSDSEEDIVCVKASTLLDANSSVKGTKNIVSLDSSGDDVEEIPTQSIVSWILEKGRCPTLQKIIQNCEVIRQVKELPHIYNGDIVFELPPVLGDSKRMEGMEQRFDGHIWTRPHKTNMSIDGTVRLSYCLGALVCRRVNCPYYVNGKFNSMFFHGHLDKQVSKGLLCEDEKLKITCHYCKRVVFCEHPCACKVYYVLPSSPKMSRMMVHIGFHSHDVQSGTSRASIERIRKMVSNILSVDKNNGPRRVQMMVARQLLVDAIVGTSKRKIGDIELSNILEEMIPLIQNKR